MDSIFEHYKKTGYLHHAYIIEGGREEMTSTLLSALRQYMGIHTLGNPDLAILEYQSLGIDESRDLSQRQSRRGFSAPTAGGKDDLPRKIFIICAESFTEEAQNSLLKTFEEPTPHTHFFVIIPRLHIVVPTLRSRVVLVRAQNVLQSKDETKDFAEKFLNTQSLEERFAFIKKLTEVKKGELIDREKIRSILDHIERMLYTRFAGEKFDMSKQNDIFRGIYRAKEYLADRGSSPKMLLEQLAVELSFNL